MAVAARIHGEGYIFPFLPLLLALPSFSFSRSLHFPYLSHGKNSRPKKGLKDASEIETITFKRPYITARLGPDRIVRVITVQAKAWTDTPCLRLEAVIKPYMDGEGSIFPFLPLSILPYLSHFFHCIFRFLLRFLLYVPYGSLQVFFSAFAFPLSLFRSSLAAASTLIIFPSTLFRCSLFHRGFGCSYIPFRLAFFLDSSMCSPCFP